MNLELSIIIRIEKRMFYVGNLLFLIENVFENDLFLMENVRLCEL